MDRDSARSIASGLLRRQGVDNLRPPKTTTKIKQLHEPSGQPNGQLEYPIKDTQWLDELAG